MRILNYSNSKDRTAIEKLIRREPLLSLRGVGSRASLTKKTFGKNLTPEQVVDRVVNDVRQKGDKTLFAYTRKFDGFAINTKNIRVTKAEIKSALMKLKPSMRAAIDLTINNVRLFHKKKKPSRWFNNGMAFPFHGTNAHS